MNGAEHAHHLKLPADKAVRLIVEGRMRQEPPVWTPSSQTRFMHGTTTL